MPVGCFWALGAAVPVLTVGFIVQLIRTGTVRPAWVAALLLVWVLAAVNHLGGHSSFLQSLHALDSATAVTFGGEPVPPEHVPAVLAALRSCRSYASNHDAFSETLPMEVRTRTGTLRFDVKACRQYPGAVLELRNSGSAFSDSLPAALKAAGLPLLGVHWVPVPAERQGPELRLDSESVVGHDHAWVAIRLEDEWHHARARIDCERRTVRLQSPTLPAPFRDRTWAAEPGTVWERLLAQCCSADPRWPPPRKENKP